MTDAAIAELLKQGLTGLVILGMAAAIINLWKDNKDLRQNNLALQQQRVEDMKAVQTKLLENNTQCVTALTNAANAMEAQAQSTQELKNAFTVFGDELRRRRT